MIAPVPPVEGAGAVFTASAAPSKVSPIRPLALIINSTIIDSQGLSPSLQPSDPGTPTTSSAGRSSPVTTNSDVNAQLPLAGPMVAGVLVGIILITTIVVICFLQRRRKRRRHSFDETFTFPSDSHPHQHSKRRVLGDEIPLENHSRKKKYRRYSRRSRYSSGSVELEVQNSLPQDKSQSEVRAIPPPLGNRQWHSGSSPTNSTLSLTLSTGSDKLNRYDDDDSQTSPTFVPSTVLFNQVEQYSPRPIIELPLQPLSSSSQNEPIYPPKHISPALLPEAGQHLLNTLTQQRAALLAFENTSDKSVHGELLLLEEQIQTLRRQDVFLLPQRDIPPPYKHE